LGPEALVNAVRSTYSRANQIYKAR